MIRRHYTPIDNKKDVNCNRTDPESNHLESSNNFETSLLQLEFVKSALTINPCMVSTELKHRKSGAGNMCFSTRVIKVTCIYKEKTNFMLIQQTC